MTSSSCKSFLYMKTARQQQKHLFFRHPHLWLRYTAVCVYIVELFHFLTLVQPIVKLFAI